MRNEHHPHQFTPPMFGVRLLRAICNDELSDAVLGDLTELYQHRRSRMNKHRADVLFYLNVLQFVQPFAIKKRKSSYHINQQAMLNNYFKVGIRNMNRHKMYSAITIGGFALGLATCLLIFLYITDELSYDKHYAQGDRIFRLYNNYNTSDGGSWMAMPPSVASILREEFPDVEKAARLIPYKWFSAGSNLMRRDDVTENTFEEGFAYADPDLLDVLEIPMVYGNHQQALDKAHTIVISRRMSEKYFGNTDPTGKTLILNDDKDKGAYTIGGVMENFPTHSHLQYDFFLTLTGVEFWQGEQTSWCCWNYDHYVRLRPGVNVADLEKKLLSIRDKYQVAYLNETGDAGAADVKLHHFYKLQKISDVHLNPEKIGDQFSHGDIRYLWLFGGVATFILALACINFINLSTARSANRAKEVGLRKAVGSGRAMVMRQFLAESLMYSYVSFAIAVIICVLAMPYFNSLAGKSLVLPWTTIWFVPGILAAAFVIGILAGLYPSFYLSAFQPVQVLRGTLSRGSKSSTLRGAMVVFQFSTSIILIIGTLVISRQIDFIMNTKIGFEKDQVLMIQGANTLGDQHKSFKAELKKLANVDHVTISSYLPVAGTNRDQNGTWLDGRSKIDKAVGAQHWYVDEDYMETMGMKLLEGRNFIQDMASDSSSVIINQSMAKALGLKKPVGEKIMTWKTFNIIGVVEDFHYENMKGPIRPLFFSKGSGGLIVCVKGKGNQMQSMITSAQSVWDKFMPNQPFRYTFMSDSFAIMYDDVKRTGSIFFTFAALAIIVACLGLFALSAFMIEQRTKEIAVRLVLGASGNSILRLLGQNFVRLIAVSFIIAVPIGWYLINIWLQDYEYKIPLTWDVFVMSGALALSVAVITISFQTIKAARSNPANGLRTE
ncbi:ABC transporter permease [Chryseolinea sp. T2]|uniref:ABC transporter permease n=1 Tax=Chryseolinea sp. T2 TaxID=3129255 RepID=UPI003077691C